MQSSNKIVDLTGRPLSTYPKSNWNPSKNKMSMRIVNLRIEGHENDLLIIHHYLNSKGYQFLIGRCNIIYE